MSDLAHLKELAQRYRSLDEALDELAIKKKDLNAEQEQVEAAILLVMETAEVTRVDLGDAAVIVRAGTYPAIVGDKDLVTKWLDEHGAQDVTPRKLSVKLLKEYLELCLEQDKPLPPDHLIHVKPHRELCIRKLKPKGA